MNRDRSKALAGFRFALRQFIAASEAISRTARVTQQQYQVMLAIGTWSCGAMTMKDLAGDLLLTHHAAVQMVDRLARSGHVARAPSAKDRRSVSLALTPDGEALLDRLAALHLEAVLRQEPALTTALQRLKLMGPQT